MEETYQNLLGKSYSEYYYMKVLDYIIWLRNFLLVFSLLKMQNVYFVILKFKNDKLKCIQNDDDRELLSFALRAVNLFNTLTEIRQKLNSFMSSLF